MAKINFPNIAQENCGDIIPFGVQFPNSQELGCSDVTPFNAQFPSNNQGVTCYPACPHTHFYGDITGLTYQTILGRYSAATGVAQLITLGAGLSLSAGGVLSSTGASGTVTSVAASITGNSLGITGSPITTSGTLAFTFAGTNLQYINGAGDLTTFPSLTGFVTSVTGTAPVVSSGGTTPDISMAAATNSVDGYLTAADFTIFNNKQATISLTTTGTSGASTLIGATLNIPNYGSALTGYVPYTGATQDVDLGAFKLNAQSLHAKGTGGLGHLGLKHQSASATASANEVSLFADSNGDLSWLNGNVYLSKFITSGNTANRSYTFPNVAGTVTLGTGTANNITKWTNANTVTNASSTDDGTTLTDTIRTVNSFGNTVSAPATNYTGTWYAGGTATTTKPHLLLEPSGTTSTGWSTNGTALGVNAASGSLANLADFQRAGVTLWKTGQNTTNDTLTTQTGIGSATATNFYLFTGMSNATDLIIGSTRNGTYPAAATYSSIINENGGNGIRITPYNNTRLIITGDLAITNNSKFFKTSTNGVKYLGAGIERASNAEVPLSFGTTNLTISNTEFCWAYNMPLTLAATSTTGYGMLLQHTITASAISQTAYGLYLNQTFSNTLPYSGVLFSRLKLAAGSVTVAPMEWTSGAVLTTARAGVMEFLTDSWYGTTTTGAIRRMFVAGNTGRATAQTAANTSVATYTLSATEATYEVSANVLVTTSSAENFTVTCTYTDEGNTARTITLNFSLVAGTIGTAIAFANGAVPYEGIPLHIRVKASTTITIKTTGTFTGCTYNVEGVIKQIA